MTKEKQIEDMARTICQSNREGICGYDGKPCDFHCGNYDEATKFYNAGYRKASEVAREIFEEIEESLHNLAQLYLNCDLKDNFGICYSIYEEAVLPIKKKYTESEDTNEQ